LSPLPPQDLAVKGAHRGGRCRASDSAVPAQSSSVPPYDKIATVGTTRRSGSRSSRCRNTKRAPTAQRQARYISWR